VEARPERTVLVEAPVVRVCPPLEAAVEGDSPVGAAAGVSPVAAVAVVAVEGKKNPR